NAGELISQAHLQRTPRDVRAMLTKLMQGQGSGFRVQGSANTGDQDSASLSSLNPEPRTLNPSSGINLDDAYLSGVLQDLVDKSAGNVETVTTNAVPVINRVSAGYPKDFTDLSYPKGVADEYV